MNIIVKQQLSDFVKMVGAEKLISKPTPQEQLAFEGILFEKGIPNQELIISLEEFGS